MALAPRCLLCWRSDGWLGAAEYSPRGDDLTPDDGEFGADGADEESTLEPELVEPELGDPELVDPELDAPPPPSPRGTALPVRSPDDEGCRLCAPAGITPTATTATKVPISNCPRVI